MPFKTFAADHGTSTTNEGRRLARQPSEAPRRARDVEVRGDETSHGYRASSNRLAIRLVVEATPARHTPVHLIAIVVIWLTSRRAPTA